MMAMAQRNATQWCDNLCLPLKKQPHGFLHSLFQPRILKANSLIHYFSNLHLPGAGNAGNQIKFTKRRFPNAVKVGERIIDLNACKAINGQLKGFCFHTVQIYVYKVKKVRQRNAVQGFLHNQLQKVNKLKQIVAASFNSAFTNLFRGRL